MKIKAILKYLIAVIIGALITIGICHFAVKPTCISKYNPLSARVTDILENPKIGDKFIIPIESFQQETEYSCAGAIIKSLLNFYGILDNRTETDISKGLKTGFSAENAGTHPDNMIAFLKENGLEVISGDNATMDMVYHYINQGIPVIALDSTWGGHWRAIVGYDFGGDYDKWENNDLFIVDPEFRTMEPIVDHEHNLITENESRFYDEWYEDKLFEKERKNYYIIAYPKNHNITNYSE